MNYLLLTVQTIIYPSFDCLNGNEGDAGKHEPVIIDQNRVSRDYQTPRHPEP